MRLHNLHHIHKRKRATISKNLKKKDLKPYPNSNPAIKFLDKALIFIATIGPLLTIPQIVKVFTLQNATGLSMFSWLTWAFLDIPWIIYGFVHKNKPIIISYTLYLITNLLVVLGIILYG